jgi:hypothetical protein
MLLLSTAVAYGKSDMEDFWPSWYATVRRGSPASGDYANYVHSAALVLPRMGPEDEADYLKPRNR